MGYAGFMWECECGHIEYKNTAPNECPKCGKIKSFVKVPEEIADEREKDKLEEMYK